MDGPSMSNNIAVPDASGVFVVEAIAPLYVNTSGAVSIAQRQILQVGQLIAGSIGRSFGESSACIKPDVDTFSDTRCSHLPVP